MAANCCAFFADEKGLKLLDHLRLTVPQYVEQRSPKLKPIRGGAVGLEQMRIKKGPRAYRMAFRITDDTIECCYLSTPMLKRIFDAEANKALAKAQRQ